MKKIVSNIKKVVKALNKHNITFVSEDGEFPVKITEISEVFVTDDSDRDEWVALLLVQATHSEIETALVSVLGQPNKKVHRSDLGLDVNNWYVGPVHIVHVQEEVTFIQEYTKK